MEGSVWGMNDGSEGEEPLVAWEEETQSWGIGQAENGTPIN